MRPETMNTRRPARPDTMTIGASGQGRTGRGYYALRMNGWLALSLNSEAAAGYGSAQADWLESELMTSDASCVLTFFHKPAVSTKPRRDSEHARRHVGVLHRYGATLVLNGHNHFYERARPLDAGGTGRSPLRGRDLRGGNRPHASRRRERPGGAFGTAADQYSWRFLSAETDDALDAGSGTCNARRQTVNVDPGGAFPKAKRPPDLTHSIG